MTARLMARAAAPALIPGRSVLPPAAGDGPRVWQIGVYEVDTGGGDRQGAAERCLAGPVSFVGNDPQVVYQHVAAWATQERVRAGRARVKARLVVEGRRPR